MKKILLSICLIVSLNSISQDSTKVTITPQTRDLEFIAAFIFNDYDQQELFDSTKVKFRSGNPPTNNTTVSVTAYTTDWYDLFVKINSHPLAIKGGTKDRIETLLRAVNQVYLTGKLDALVTADQNAFLSLRIFGRKKLIRN